MTPISRELIEVEKEKKEYQKERARTKRYRAKTQNLMPSSCENESSHVTDSKGELHDDHDTRSRKKYQKTLRSSGVVGVPAIKAKELTKPVEFNFQTDQRAAAKKIMEEQGLTRSKNFSSDEGELDLIESQDID